MYRDHFEQQIDLLFLFITAVLVFERTIHTAVHCIICITYITTYYPHTRSREQCVERTILLPFPITPLSQQNRQWGNSHQTEHHNYHTRSMSRGHRRNRSRPMGRCPRNTNFHSVPFLTDACNHLCPKSFCKKKQARKIQNLVHC